jgi:DNA primase
MNRQHTISLLQPFIEFADDELKSNNVAAYCPFHKEGKERRPSFYVYVGPRTHRKSPGSAFCHTCNKGWSLTSLLRDLGAGYIQVNDIVEDLDGSYEKPHPINSLDFTLPKLPDAMLGAFDFVPKSLLQEGFSEEILKDFEVGFDRRRKRITFPIRDHLGNLVGVSGRTVVNALPRYKVYRQELYEVDRGYELKKGRVLWNLHSFFHRNITQGVYSPVIVTEGFKAAMWVTQCGFKETVALLGVHLTKEQKFLLTTVANTVILFLDNDEAGKEGTKKIAKALGSEIQVKIARYPSQEKPTSPDDLAKDEVILAVNLANTPLERILRDKS